MSRSWVVILFLAVLGLCRYLLAADQLVKIPAGLQKDSSAQYVVQLSLPGQKMPAKVDQFNWQYASYHHKFILVNFEMDFATLQSTGDLEDCYHRVLAAVDALRSQGYDIPPDNIVLTGTSRGGSLALSLALHHPETFKRIGVVSGAFPWFWVNDISANARGLHFFIVHGKDDAVVPLDRAQKTIDHLIKMGAIVKYEILDHAGHNLNSAAYGKVLDWIADDLKQNNNPPKLEVQTK